jgi:hypothetical protein
MIQINEGKIPTGGDSLVDKKTWDQSHTTKSNNAQERERKTAGSPMLKTKGLEFKEINKETIDHE